MKLIYIVNSFPTDSEVFVYNEVRKLIEYNNEVFFFPIRLNKNAKNGKDLEKFNILNGISNYFEWVELIKGLIIAPLKNIYIFRNYIIKYGFNFRKLGTSLSSLGHANKLSQIILNNEMKDWHLHAHFAGRTAEICMFTKYLIGIEYSITIHAVDIFVPDDKNKLIDRLENAKGIIAISEFGKEFIRSDKRFSNVKYIKTIHCGMDLPTTKTNMKSINSKTLLCVARLVEKKGIEYLFEAINILGDKQIKLVLIGDGPLKPNLINLANQLNLTESVLFLGSISNLEVREWYLNSDLFVLPCVRASDGDMDGIPVSLMEAMSYGLPVISTNISGISELIEHKKSGILVEEKNPSALAIAINSILNDNDMRTKISDGAREKIKSEFNLGIEVKKTEIYFKDLYKKYDKKIC